MKALIVAVVVTYEICGRRDAGLLMKRLEMRRHPADVIGDVNDGLRRCIGTVLIKRIKSIKDLNDGLWRGVGTVKIRSIKVLNDGRWRGVGTVQIKSIKELNYGLWHGVPTVLIESIKSIIVLNDGL